MAISVRNQEKDDLKLSFKSKGRTLQDLHNQLTNAYILPLTVIQLGEWRQDKNHCLEKIKSLHSPFLAIRSSAINEDTMTSSAAGKYKTFLNVHGEDNIIRSIDEVISSYENVDDTNEVIIQAMATSVRFSGVAFSKDPNTNSPYIVINYDDQSVETDTITSGSINQSKCLYWHKSSTTLPTDDLSRIIALVFELEKIYSTDAIDIEFAMDNEGELCLFQVRPLILNKTSMVTFHQHEAALSRIYEKINVTNKPHPYLYGKNAIYGVMPDWNPAEIIGIRPKPLALSLYRELVTDSIWAYQRDNYGYKNLRSFPLLIDFEGLPYVDVRVSFNSFVPKSIDDRLSHKLVDYYLDQLKRNPTLHDKVEFEIIFSCYTLDLKSRLSVLRDVDFSESEIETIHTELVRLTDSIIKNKDSFWMNDYEKIKLLEERQAIIIHSDLDAISKIYWLLEDCKRYGTLPFAGLARAAFVSVQLLNSFMSTGIISKEEHASFFSSINSVSSAITSDLATKSKSEFLAIYGHLRPGTYDITAERYDENPEKYFDFEKVQANSNSASEQNYANGRQFSLNIDQLKSIQKRINDDGLQLSVLDLLDFIKSTIEWREYAKFVFSKSISESMKILTQFALKYGYTREECSYLDAKIIADLYSTSSNPDEILNSSIALGKSRYLITQSIHLPPLLTQADDVWSFHYPETLPNYITLNKAEGHVCFENDDKVQLKGAVLFIPSADPGYDWIFSHQIAGFITKFGGVNSHMAIRAGELQIPAVIGAGETNFNQWSQYHRICIDASNKKVIAL